MPVTIDATVGGADANSYVTLAESTTYFGNRLNASAWTGAASDDVRAQALIMATARLGLERWTGTPVNPLTGRNSDTTQALQWPRYGALDPDGYEYLYTVIPEPVKRATMELALHYLRLGTTDPQAPTGLEGIASIARSVGVGPITVDFRDGAAESGADDFPDDVRRIVADLLTTQRGSIRLVRG